jgi:hypothetical protein
MMDAVKIKTLIDTLTEKEAAAVLPLIETIVEDVRDFKAKNGWHYVSEEGLPEAGQYYFIAYNGPLGISGCYCKLVNKSVPGLPVYDKEGCLVRTPMDGSFTIKEWDCPEDAETKAWLNENGRVYAWMPLPALPEVKE